MTTSRTEALREAFVGGASWAGYRIGRDFYAARCEAAQTYPFPTITQPRVVTHAGREYRINDGRLEVSNDGRASWFSSAHNTMSGISDLAEPRLAWLLALLANPTETVEVSE